MEPQLLQPGADETSLLSRGEHEQLSTRRIQVRLVAFTVGLLGMVSTLIFLLVSQIFGTLTPPLQRDLEHKALQGISLLSRELDLGLLTEDRDLIARAAKDYVSDTDVLSILAVTPDGRELYQHGARAKVDLFQGPPHTLRKVEGHLAAWSEVRLESVVAGRVALVISTERVAAGGRLRLRILGAAALAGLLALGAALLFVNLYVVPILRIARATIRRLEQTTVHALAATRLKSEFLANMSHEIRTPMNGVLAMSDLLIRGGLEDRQLRLAEIIRTSARSLLTIIDDVLDFSKIEAGKYEIFPAPFDVRMAVRDVVELLAPRAHGKGIELACRVTESVPRIVQNDVDRFRQVITNLVGNAVKFTERGQVVVTVDVGARDEERVELLCTVADSGPGISAEGLSKLFVSFSQVDASSTRQHGGTGLGLAISQSLAHLMGGEITVESRFGAGSTFRLRIACEVIEELAPAPRFAAAGKRALLVDDNEPTRTLLASQLERYGMKPASATTAFDAMIQLETAIMEGAPYEVVFVAEPLAGGGAVELASAIAKSSTPTAVALLVHSGVRIEATDLPEGLPLLEKPLRESEVFDFLISAFQLPENQNDGPSRPPRRTSSPSRGGHVLAVDDNEINQTVAIELLQELGYTVDVASNGQEALTAIKRGQYDAVLMDCQMPVLDGYQATREIRAWEASEGHARVPIIALTAHAISGERDKVLSAGMDDYLTKPILGASLERALARHVTVEAKTSSPARQRRLVQTTARARRILSDAPLPAADHGGRPDLLDPAVQRSAKVNQLFLELVPPQLEGLLSACRDGATELIKARAHKLKGGCLSVGATALTKLCLALEQAAAAGHAVAARQQAEALPELYEQTAALLRAELSGGVRAS
jgi:signal transduction histidine kinase/CheY-like chemotaxis protein/HPt (histidine-containing phosphotransfer) domain-containing protein